MNNILNNILYASIGASETKIHAHWAYYVSGAIFVILFLLSIWFIYWSLKNKTNYYINPSERLSWLKEFWYKNRPLFSIIISIIFLLSSIMFFLAASGQLE